MIPAEIAVLLEEVSEDLIKSAAASIEGENNFTKLLRSAELFRKANAEPIFLSNADYSAFCVSSKETFGTRLH